MVDNAPKPPVKPSKAGRRPVRDAVPMAKTKPVGKTPVVAAPPVAIPETPAPVAAQDHAAAQAPVVPDIAPAMPPEPVAEVVPEPATAMPIPVAEAPSAVPVVPPPVPSTPVSSTPVPILSSAPVPASIPLTAAKEVIMETIENVTAKTQTAFADATAQAKGAVEKSQKMFEDANEFGKGNIEALVESSKIAVRGLEALSQDAAAYAKSSFEEATAAVKTMTSVKSPTELLKLQSDYARSAFDSMVQQTSRNTEAMLKLAGEVVQPLSNRVALAAEKMKVVA